MNRFFMSDFIDKLYFELKNRTEKTLIRLEKTPFLSKNGTLY
jgi:hypothetical protein